MSDPAISAADRARFDRAENTMLGLAFLFGGAGVWYFLGAGGVCLYLAFLFVVAALRINQNKRGSAGQ